MTNVDRAAIEAWLKDYVARTLKLAPEQVKLDKHFDRYGLDSVALVALTGDLSDWLRTEISPTMAYDHPTIDRLAGAVLAQVDAATPAQA